MREPSTKVPLCWRCVLEMHDAHSSELLVFIDLDRPGGGGYSYCKCPICTDPDFFTERVRRGQIRDFNNVHDHLPLKVSIPVFLVVVVIILVLVRFF